MIVDTTLPSSIWSSTADTVTVWGVSQSSLVKVSVPRSTRASVASSAEMVRTTSEPGSAVRTTLKESVVPDSLTCVLDAVSTTAKPAASSSVVVALTVCSGTRSKASSEATASTEIVRVVA